MAMTVWTFVGKVMSLLFNTLSRFGEGNGSSLQCSCLEKSLVGYHLWVRTELDTTVAT